MTGAENAGLVLSASFGVSLLLFLITPAKTRKKKKKVPLIRCIGFAERERETFGLLIFHLSFLILMLIIILNLSLQTANVK